MEQAAQSWHILADWVNQTVVDEMVGVTARGGEAPTRFYLEAVRQTAVEQAPDLVAYLVTTAEANALRLLGEHKQAVDLMQQYA